MALSAIRLPRTFAVTCPVFGPHRPTTKMRRPQLERAAALLPISSLSMTSTSARSDPGSSNPPTMARPPSQLFTTRLPAKRTVAGLAGLPLPMMVPSAIVGEEVALDGARRRDRLDAEGRKEIGARLGISARTAEAHRRAIARKLGIRSIAELVKYALLHQLATLEE